MPRGRENSRIATLPPGRAARIISSRPRVVSRTFRRPKATLTTPKGQKLFVTTLLPVDAAISSEAATPLAGVPAVEEPMVAIGAGILWGAKHTRALPKGVALSSRNDTGEHIR